MSHLQIIRSAPAMHFQDLGRYGYSHLGLSQGGPLDLHAHCWANHLLENSADCAVIEISLGNAVFEAKQDLCIAITGAEMQATIDGQAVHNWSSHSLRKGQTLKFHYSSKGLHAYLAIKHGFDSPKILGSNATVIRNGLGKMLEADAELSANSGPPCLQNYPQKRTPHHYIPDYDDIRDIHLILPPKQSRALSSEIVNSRLTISPHSDRMGINLNAETPLPSQDGILSEGLALGSVQLPPDGHPIVLMQDRQTQGGYAKVGTIARIDLPLLAQARPGTRIKFIPSDLRKATREWADFVKFFKI